MALGAPVLPLNHVVFTVQAEIRPAMGLFTKRVDTPRGPKGWKPSTARTLVLQPLNPMTPRAQYLNAVLHPNRGANR